jgi:hypothetical protein
VVTNHPAGLDAGHVNQTSTTQPSRYRVVIRGHLGEHLAGAFEQFELESRPGASSLTGRFVDQAQLYGLLDGLRDLGIPLVSVNPVD